VALSQKYLDSAQKKADQEKKDLGIVVKNYRLNPENVFGAEQAAPSGDLASQAAAELARRSRNRGGQ
jgi:hypothetical protein